MNTSHRHTNTTHRHGLRSAPAVAGGHRRGGAALIVVISLLGTLAFLGFLFYSFAAQEVASAEYFSRSETPDVPLPPDVFWDWSLKQLIVGTDAGLANSALYGNKYSILANMIGSPNRDASSNTFGATPGALDLTWGVGGTAFDGDTQPFDGAGITTIMGTSAGTYLTANSPMEFGFDIDQDGLYDPATEPDWTNFVLNFSPAADSPLASLPLYSNNGTAYSNIPQYAQYQPDAGYTYPDINSLFLGYDTTVRGWDNDNNTVPRDFRVIIPSFFRPQLFPTRRGTNNNTGGDPNGTNGGGFADIYLLEQTARQVLRPHVAHWAGLNSSGTPVRRYVPPAIAAYAGELDGPDDNGDMIPDGIRARSGDTNRVIRPFPFVVDLDNDGNTLGNFNEMGVWTNPRQGQVTPSNQVNYELDVDADGDGVRDAIWIDLDFPMMTLEDGRQFVPMFAFKVIDADALLNINAHGNAHGLYVRLQNGDIQVIGPNGTAIVGAAGMAENLSFHLSNQGQSPAEVNLSLALTADLRNDAHVDPRASDPVSIVNDADRVASQFELATNYGYTPTAEYGPGTPEFSSPSVKGTSNFESLMILNGRRVFERLRNGNVRETRQQVLGRHGDRFKIRELYRRLAFGDPDYPDGLSDGEDLPGPLPGGYNLDDDGDSNQVGLAPFFGGSGDDDLDAPGVGQPGDPADDNFKRGGGSFYYDQDLYGVQIPPAVHPLDPLGTGSGIYNRDASSGAFLRRQLTNPTHMSWTLMNNPSVFVSYLDQLGIDAQMAGTGFPLNYWHFNGRPVDLGEADLSGVTPWRMGLNAPPPDPLTPAFLDVNNPLYDFQIDEPNEVILEQELRNPEYDSVFPTYEMEGLHLAKSDASKIKAANVLSELAPFNLKRSREEVRSQIARRLTTDSWDRLEPGQTRWRAAAGPTFDRQWEFRDWTGAGADFFTDGQETFPPEFADGAGGRTPAGSALDPIRPALRLLLKNERLYSGSVTGDLRYPRKRLNINRILSGEEPAAGLIDRRVFDDEGEPRFRQLTPHPNVTELLKIGPIDPVTIPPMIHDHFALGTDFTSVSGPPAGVPPFDNLGLDPTVPAASADRARLVEAQEWWARYDRQRLARDIYTLLYTLGGGDDSFDPTTGTYDHTNPDVNSNSINDNVEAMAQFAVNYVDALDRDNVITKFEYDINLNNGWESTPGTGDLRIVDGVEAQQLTFSEVVWTRTADSGGDNYDNTPWDDDDGHHQFLHIELRSVSPFDVELGNDAWRIVRTEPQVDPSAGVMQQARVTFQRNPGMQALAVGPGENFTLGASDKNAHAATATPELPADFYVRTTAGGDWQCIVPAGTSTATDLSMVNPRTDLDLVADTTKPQEGSTVFTNYTDYYNLEAGTTANGQLVHLVGLTTPTTDDTTTTEFDLVLQRRRHLNAEGMLGLSNDTLSNNLDSPESSDWIEVDRIRVTVNEFIPDNNDDVANEVQQQITSQYRLEPLSAPGDPTMQPTTANGDLVNHTIADLWDMAGTAENPNRHLANVRDPGSDTPATAFTLWQPHFDRDYASIFELLTVPLFGPDDLTRRLAYDESPVDANAPRLTGEYFDITAAAPRPALAGKLFMNTDPFGDTDPIAGTGFEDDNRWYRLLEYLQIPNRAEEAIRERLTRLVRTPGKINLNTLRDEQALAALIDDPAILRMDLPGQYQTTSTGLFVGGSSTGDVEGDTGFRNWMDELRLARDGIDPVNFFATNANDRTYLPLPGIPGMVGDSTDTAAEYGAGAGRPQFGAVPFRPLSYASPVKGLTVDTNATPHDSPIPPTAHTILRNHVGPVADDSGSERINRADVLSDLQLFEARPTTDLGTDEYDYHTRNRLLAKLANNATERSNVFICWIVVEFFEAHQPDPVNTPQIVQVGGKLEGSPTHRGFFIIDRSRIERAVDQDSIARDGSLPVGQNANFRFDWREFVIHRRTIQ